MFFLALYFLFFAFVMFLRYRNLAKTLLQETPNNGKHYPQKYTLVRARGLDFFGMSAPKRIPTFIYRTYYYAIASLVSGPITIGILLVFGEHKNTIPLLILIHVFAHVVLTLVLLMQRRVFKKK